MPGGQDFEGRKSLDDLAIDMSRRSNYIARVHFLDVADS